MTTVETLIKFKEYFGFNMPLDGIMSAAFRKPVLDIIKMDSMVGTPDGISMSDHITTKYGKKAADFVRSII